MSKIERIRHDIKIDEGTGAVDKVVQLLERTLEEAKRGEVAAIAMVVIDPGSQMNTYWTGGVNHHLMVAGTVYLQFDLANGQGG